MKRRAVFDRFAIWRTVAPVEMTPDSLANERAAVAARADVADKARRWSRAYRAGPDLAIDIIQLGGILTAQPMQPNGDIDARDHGRLAYEAGRRDFAVQLLSLMNLSPFDLNTLMENDDA